MDILGSRLRRILIKLCTGMVKNSFEIKYISAFSRKDMNFICFVLTVFYYSYVIL